MLTVIGDQIVQWLASTAKKHGHVASKGIGATKAPDLYLGPQTHTVARKECLTLAEYIAKQARPIIVPVKLAEIMEGSITARRNPAQIVIEDPDDSGEE